MLRKKRPFIVWMLTLLFLLSQAGIAGAAPAGQAQPTGETPFTDVSSTNKNVLYIKYMANRGLINGFPDGTYHPGEGLTRAQAAVLFCKIRGLNPTDKDSTFSDVADSHWAAGYIAAAVKAGYITGFPDGTYRPQATLTRAQGINLFLQLATEKDSSEEIPALQDLDKNHWAANSLAIALAAGMIEAQGNNIKPEQPFARGDLARALSILMTKDPGLNQQELIGRLKVKNGTVEIKRAGSEKVQTINTASIVRKGDTITTGKDGQVEINYPDGSGILLKPDSELIIKTSIGRAYIVKDGRPGTAVEDLQVELTNGKLFGALASKYTGKEETEEEAKEIAAKNKYSKIASRDKNFDLMAAKSSAQPWYKTAEKKKVKVKVDMPWGVAAIRGSFWSNTVGSNSCGMSLLQGDGSLSSGGQTQNLSPGQSSGSGSSGGPPSPPGPMSPSESREWSQQRGWVGERAGEMNNNQGASDPGSEGQGEGEGEGEGDDPGDEPPDNLMDNLNDALDQADQNAASGSSGSSGGGSSGGSGSSTPVIVLSGMPGSLNLPSEYSGCLDYTVSPDDATVSIVNSDDSVASVTVGYNPATSCPCLEIKAGSVAGNTVIIITATREGYISLTHYIYITVTEWIDLGSTSGSVSGLSLAVREGVPHVSFINSSVNAVVYSINSVGDWAQVGGPFGSGLAASSIDFKSDSTFFVAVGPSTSGDTQQVELYEYSEGWTSPTNPVSHYSYLPDLYVDKTDNYPYLAYGGTYEEAATYHIGAVSTYNSSDGWSAPAGDNFYEDEKNPLEALAHTRYDSNSYVAYIANGVLYVKVGNDGWGTIPESPSTPDPETPVTTSVKTASGVDLELLYGNPVVAYANGSGSLTVMQWVYNSGIYEWQPISPTGSNPVGDSPVKLFVDNNTLYLAYAGSDQKVSVMKYNGSTWSYIGSSGFSDPVATGPGTLDLYVENGYPYIFYKNNSNGKGYVMKGPAQPLE